MRTLRSMILGAALLALSACGPLRYNLQTNQLAPGGDVSITAAVDKDAGQTRLNMVVANLVPADRIRPGMSKFVTWQRKDPTQTWSRVGAMEYAPGERTGELKDATVPLTEFDVQVTLETDASPPTPSPEVLFGQHIGGPKK